MNRSKTAALPPPRRRDAHQLSSRFRGVPDAQSCSRRYVGWTGGNYDYTDTGSGGYPAADTSISAELYPPAGNENFTTSTIGQTSAIGYTDVTSDLYYSGGHLGTLKIPAIGINVKIYQGTDSATLTKGAGHFTDTSIWAGNVCVAGHNRGTNCYFGKIHTLNIGDEITLTTKLGTRTYAVTSVEKISETDNSMLAAASGNCVTLFTCVRNEREYHWCVRAEAV